jgi:DNA primase large subunit
MALRPGNIVETEKLMEITFYQNNPEVYEGYDEIYSMSYDRICLLKEIELIYTSQPNQEARNNEILKKEKQFGFDSHMATKYPKFRERDELSHFIVKLAYSSRQDEINWFVNQETRLFRARLSYYNSIRLNYILHENLGFRYKQLTEKDFKKLPFFDQTDIQIGFYKVPFIHAYSLMPDRFPINGYVYVPPDQLYQVVCEVFSTILEQSLKSLTSVEIDNIMLKTILENVDTPESQSYEAKNLDLDISNIETAAQTHFPPCMKRLYTTFRTNHHLKHFGRLQLGLFLKGLGFSIEDAIRFWCEEFCQTMTVDKFIKTYKYSIRYYYRNYHSLGCNEIIKFEGVGESEYHGCPFRHAQIAELYQILASYKLNQPDIENILKKSYNHPQIACIHLFKASHENAAHELIDFVGRHPSAFYDASRQYQKSRRKYRNARYYN